MPGEPVSNDDMDRYIAPLNRISGRIKQRILAENGIKQRHYAIGPEGETVFSNAQLAANAIRDCLRRNESELADVSMLASGSSGGDALMPGFANMIQGEMAAHPMETLSCMASAPPRVGHPGGRAGRGTGWARQRPGRGQRAALAPVRVRAARATMMPISMRTSCAGCCPTAPALLLATPAARCRRLARCACGSWVHQRSFSGDYPVCMQLGLSADRQRGHLDYRPGPTPRPTARCRCARISGCCRTCSTSASTNTPSWCAMAG